jgi:predicted nucleotidyltransferase
VFTSLRLLAGMAALPGGLYGCFRCAYVWRPVRSHVPTMCPRCKSRFWDVPVLRAIRRGYRMGIAEVLTPRREALLHAVRQRGFGHVRVFGSVRRSEATSESDVDLLVDRVRDTSLLDRAALTEDLEAILGRRVDVVPEEALHWYVRPQVLFEAIRL